MLRLRILKKKFKVYPEIKILQANAFKLPFKAETFDVSILSMTLVNFEDKKLDAILEMKRVIKREGKIILSVYSENAESERLYAYNQAGLPIKDIHGGKFIF